MVAWSRRTLLAAGGLLLAGCTAPVRDANDAPGEQTRPVRNWTTAGYDAANTGYVPTANPVREGTKEWRFEADSRSDILAGPVVVDGTVYAGSGKTIYSISLDDGSVQWSTETNVDTGLLSGTVTDGTLVLSGLAGDDSELLAIDIETGAIDWRRSIPVSTAPTIVDDHVYIGTGNHERALTTIDTSSGDEVWSVSFPRKEAVYPARAAPAARGDTLFVPTIGDRTDGTSSTVLYAVGTDGTKRWTFRASGTASGSPTVDDTAVYFGTSDGTVHAVGTETGEKRWSADVSGGVYASPAIDGDNVYLGTRKRGLYAIEKKRGTVTWNVQATTLNTDPVVTAETVYVGGMTVQARDKNDGAGKWAYGMPSKGHAVFTSPVVIDGTVLVGACTKEKRHQSNYENYVVALGDGTGPSAIER